MRTRWEEETAGNRSQERKFSILPWALGMAIPVAFITGAAVNSFYGMSTSVAALTTGGSATGGAVGVNGERLWTAEEQNRHEFDIQNARTDAMMLRQQVEALQSRVIVAMREKEEAERLAQAAIQQKSDLELQIQNQASAVVQPVTEPTTTASLSDLEARFAPVEEPPVSVQSLSIVEQQPSSSAAIGQPSQPVQQVTPPANTSTSDLTAAVDRGDQLTAVPELFPRQPSEVQEALRNANGLNTLSGEARRDLEARLVRGECVSSSLAAAFGSTVPVVPLRDLIRGLDSDC